MREKNKDVNDLDIFVIKEGKITLEYSIEIQDSVF
jgi:hypothetical protein